MRVYVLDLNSTDTDPVAERILTTERLKRANLSRHAHPVANITVLLQALVGLRTHAGFPAGETGAAGM